MFTFILRRLLQLPVTLAGISLLVFALTMLLKPDQRATAYITNEKQLNQIPEIVQRYHLDAPFYVQFIQWFGKVLHGDLGYSTSAREPVTAALGQYFPATVELVVVAIIPIVLFGVVLGILAGVYRNRWPDQLARLLAILGSALPSFVLGIFMLAYFYGTLQWFPPGRISDALSYSLPSVDGFLLFRSIGQGQWNVVGDLLKHMIMPVAVLTLISSAQLVRVTRANMIEQLSQDYVRTARAKGLADRRVINKHALRNVLIPVITLAGILFFSLLGGVTITETVFNYPGVGAWSARAAQLLDTNGVIGYALIIAAITVISNTIVDLLYGLVDPRVRYD
ncbi:ABC transporter permease [Deinococcus maricopensis]|uniref:ABC-type transporter, integral membrane subunit n=1 Tax=Deinococcus maricopensis (strain DSM 21211 / LMG 22137 / NRRL B-23946 / LB-34) TaxID=709986 RepID=E8UBP2_DEIML|nr:ABC transporter permease [Deinococcus maricopensis]ADV68481.1 ABC-type transporter, integral membrane subunit [Deinococcus maricopensis DSM 21211]